MQNEPEQFQPPTKPPIPDWVLGIGLLLVLHLIQIPLAALSMGISLIAIGLTQLLYVIPFILLYKKRNRPGIVKGLIISSAITFFLNGTCTALFFLNPPNFH
jgi:hypothetical protein